MEIDLIIGATNARVQAHRAYLAFDASIDRTMAYYPGQVRLQLQHASRLSPVDTDTTE